MLDTGTIATRVKTVRKARKIGRPRLAKLTGLSERQLAKIETGDGAEISDDTVLRISDALRIPALALTGDFDLTEADLQPVQHGKGCGCC